MITRFSQLKQTISDEIQQASAPPRPANDPIAVIERNARILSSETPNVESIINDLGAPGNDSETELAPEDKGNRDIKGAATEKSSDGGSPETQEQAHKNTEEAESKPSTTSNEPNEKLEDNAESLKTSANGKLSKEPSPASEPITTASGSRESSPSVGAASGDPSLQAKLVKFAKYEEKYPQLLKAYKIEKKKNELVKLYEKVLSENTPCNSIAEPQVLVDYLNEVSAKTSMQQKEIQKIQSELTTSTKVADDLKKELSAAKSELSSTKSELSKLCAELETAVQKSQKQEKSAEETAIGAKKEAELKARIEMLESRLDAAEQARDSAAKSQATMRSQFEEMNTRLRENLAETDVMRDELHEAERLAQDRLHELSTLKSQLHNQEKGRRRSADEVAMQLSKAVAEKEQLEADVELLNKRIIREADQLNMKIKSLRTQLQDTEAHEAELRRQLSQSQALLSEPRAPIKSESSSVADLHSLAREGHLSNSPSSTASAAVSDAELQEYRDAAATAAKANELLKQVNSDNALRIEKLQKSQRALAQDLEQVRHENMLLRKQQSRRGSISSVTPAGNGTSVADANSETEKQQAYLKNVLFGFIEHKGQRRALMPVLATLLGLKDSEIDRFMKEFV